MEKVLIVDNDIDSLDTLERVLRKEFQVFRAGNGFEAIHVLDREGEMALVISELSMPVVDGVEFLMGIMHAYPDTVRVVLTRSLDPDLLLTAVNDLKLFRYMVKPFNREELLLVVRQGVGLYRLGKGQKLNTPPVGVLQFPEAQPEYLTIEIDQAECQAQVESLVSSPFFQALSQETDVTPPPVTKPAYFSFLDDYQAPEVELSFEIATDETKPQPEDETIFLIRDFVANVDDDDQDSFSEDVITPIDEETTALQEDTVFLIRDFINQADKTDEEKNTLIQNPKPIEGNDIDVLIRDFDSEQDNASKIQPQKEVFESHAAPKAKKDRPQPNKEKKTDIYKNENDLIEEIDTLIQKLEQEEKPKIPPKKTDNPLNSPEFKELQRQSNALIARIIRSWG